MRINIVIPPQQRHVFAGGALCLLNYAQGLAGQGHEVTVMTSLASAEPLWFPKPWRFRFLSPSAGSLLSDAVKASWKTGWALGRSVLAGRPGISAQAARDGVAALSAWSGLAGQRSVVGAATGAMIDNLRRWLPEADVTVASSFETAYPVAVAGTGRLFYFAQHYEPYFWRESAGCTTSRRQAEVSYGLGLKLIANSPWLSDMLRQHHGLMDVPVCSGAIDHRVFCQPPRPRRQAGELHVISYGGRDAHWKGFREMCEGVRLAREQYPGIRFHWRVYGAALLPPDNPIATYEPLGFLDQPALASAYARHDVLLSASWYESFPLFPLEAMASGLATICTEAGAEAYALHGQTAHVVPSQSPQAIAEALGRLARDEDYRLGLAARGREKAVEFTWDRSVGTMEQVLLPAA